MPLNGWGADCPYTGQLELLTRVWGRGSSNESDILHVDSYLSNEVFLFFESYRNMPLNGWGLTALHRATGVENEGLGQEQLQ